MKRRAFGPQSPSERHAADLFFESLTGSSSTRASSEFAYDESDAAYEEDTHEESEPTDYQYEDEFEAESLADLEADLDQDFEEQDFEEQDFEEQDFEEQDFEEQDFEEQDEADPQIEVAFDASDPHPDDSFGDDDSDDAFESVAEANDFSAEEDFDQDSEALDPHSLDGREDNDFEVDPFDDAAVALREQEDAPAPAVYLPERGRAFTPAQLRFNCAPNPFTVIPASYLPSPTNDPDAAIATALTAAGLTARQASRVNKDGLRPIARAFGAHALTELFARLRWSAGRIVEWGRSASGGHGTLVQRLLLHIPGHFRELARRAPTPQEAHALESLGWLVMRSVRSDVSSATSNRWWLPPNPDFVTAMPNPMPSLSTPLTTYVTGRGLIDTLLSLGQYNARLNTWRTGLAGRQWEAEVNGSTPGLPFYANLVTIPPHVNTAAVRALFAPAWARRLADTDAANAPSSTSVTLASLRNAVALRGCDNGNAHLPANTLGTLQLQGLEMAYNFPMTQGASAIRRLTLLGALHPVFTALFTTIKDLGWNDLVYQTSGAGCFRGIKHRADQSVNIGGRQVRVNPFSAPNQTTVDRINAHFTAAQQAKVIRATQTARRMSDHGMGIAIDINVPENGQDVAARPFGSMSPRVVALFEAFHFRWGGCFRMTDPHHFEYCNAPCAP